MVKPNTVHILTTNCEFPTNNHLYVALTTLGYEVTFVDPYTKSYQLDMPPAEEIPELVINRCGGLNFDDIDLILTLQYQHSGSFTINAPSALPIFRNKDQQLLYIKRLGLPIIPTIVQRSEFISKESLDYLDSFHSREKYILKNIRGQGGKGVIRVHSKDTLKDIIQTRYLMNDQRYIIQPFFDIKKEFRIYYVDKTPICAIEKTSTGEDQKLNLSGADFNDLELAALPKAIQKTHKKLGQLPLFFYCVDWVADQNGQLYLLEVNTIPGIDGLKNKNELVASLIANSRNYVKL